VRPDPGEPERVAGAIRRMDLRHVVLTSVSRDDLPDGGSALWAETIRAVRRTCPRATLEALVPDFSGRRESWEEVFAARPDILAHNVETVPRLYPPARPRADFSRSLMLLESAAARLPTKSGLMLGLGETPEEVRQVLRRLRSAGVRMVTIGQYLRPGPDRLPVARYVPPGEFDDLAREARVLGFEGVAAGPLVRSSYRAEELAEPAGVWA
jgi:lipoic acid synthetase